MHIVTQILQVLVALGLLNVWVLRPTRSTRYRGRDASTIMDEFAAYGLPAWSCYLVGALKIGAALALLTALWFPILLLPTSMLVAVLMVGALAMHRRVRDPLRKFMPALVMLLMSATICAIA